MDELVRWLGEQLNTDAARAEDAPPGPWTVTDSGSIVAADAQRVVCSVGGTVDGRVSRWPEGPAVEHVLAHDPARVVREIAAKQELLKLHTPVPDHGRFSDHGDCESFGCDGDHQQPPVCRSCRSSAGDPVEAPCPSLRLLALPYADRPGYAEAIADAL